jgi:peptide/nickel transport system permease protein
MAKFISKRVLLSILVVFLVSLFAFSLMHILPGDPARLALGSEASQESVEALRAELNLDKPLLTQYLLWIGGVFQGDLGHSVTYERPVRVIIAEKLPRTLAIGLPALALSVVVGITFGIISAVRRGTAIDQFITLLSTIGVGTPQFWFGILGIYLFAMKLNILPIQGFVSPSKDFGQYVYRAILPVLSLSIALVASIARQTRSNMLEVINQDYIRTARANGVAETSVLLKHALKNAVIPVITIIALQVRLVIGGTVIVENVFNIAGIGALLKVAVTSRDYLIVQGCVLIISLVVVACNLLVDILYGVFDPRIRESQRAG